MPLGLLSITAPPALGTSAHQLGNETIEAPSVHKSPACPVPVMQPCKLARGCDSGWSTLAGVCLWSLTSWQPERTFFSDVPCVANVAFMVIASRALVARSFCCTCCRCLWFGQPCRQLRDIWILFLSSHSLSLTLHRFFLFFKIFHRDNLHFFNICSTMKQNELKMCCKSHTWNSGIIAKSGTVFIVQSCNYIESDWQWKNLVGMCEKKCLKNIYIPLIYIFL